MHITRHGTVLFLKTHVGPPGFLLLGHVCAYNSSTLLGKFAQGAAMPTPIICSKLNFSPFKIDTHIAGFPLLAVNPSTVHLQSLLLLRVLRGQNR